MANLMTRDPAVDRSLRSVFVGNIPYEATEEQLKDIFSEVGPVVSFRLVYDRETGKPKGYGFCEYQDQETALSAMRNLNGREFSGRALRVDNAASEKNKEELKSLGTGAPVIESPYGDHVPAEDAPESISRAVASLPPEQMFELMKQMKLCVQNSPQEARNMLLQNPQLAYALLQAQVVMRIVDPEIAMKMLHRPVNVQPVGSNNQPGPGSNAPMNQPPPPGPQPQPMVGVRDSPLTNEPMFHGGLKPVQGGMHVNGGPQMMQPPSMQVPMSGPGQGPPGPVSQGGVMPSQMGNPPSGPGPMPRGQVQAQYKSASAMTSNAICKRNVRVWVCGNSYICSVTEHVANNPDQSNLWFPMSDLVVQWIGKADLQWDGLFQLLLEKRQHCVPDIIVLHIGENNVVNPLAELQFKIKEILNTVRAWWPRCHLVWSDILPRLHWKEAESQRAAQEVRRLHNVYMHEQMQSFGGTVIAHDIITPENKELYMPDGVHLSKAGLEIFIRDLQFGVVTAMHDILSKSQEMDEAQKLPLTDPRASMQRGPAVSGVPPPRGLLGDGPNDPRGGTLHAVTSDVDPPNRFLGAPHPGPPLHHIPPHDNRGPPAHELRGGPMEPRGMIEPRGPLLDQRGPPLDTRAGRDPRSMDARNMESRVPVPAPRVTMPGGGGGGIPNQGPIPMSSSGPQVPRPAPSLQVNSQGGGFSPAQNQVTPQDHEKAALIMQVLQLTPDQIAMLPPEQRQSILILKEQIQKSTGAS